MASKFGDIPDHISRFSDFTTELQQILPPIQGFEDKPLVSLEEAVKPLLSFVEQLNHMVWTVKKKCNQPKDGLSQDESASIMLYTLEWTPVEKSFYFILNAALRSQNRRQLIPWFLYLRLVIHALSKLPSSQSRVIYRGIKLDLSKDYLEGNEIIWWSFSSCTSLMGVLENYIGKTGKRTIFNIVLHSAKDISQHSFFETEKEYLLYPARQFKVNSVLNTGNQLHIIELEETRPPFCLIPIPVAPSTVSTEKTKKLASSAAAFSNTPSKTIHSVKIISIKRRSIDPSGRVGSLYDIRRDCLLEQQNITNKVPSLQLHHQIQCKLIFGTTDESENALKLINIDDGSRLNILLNPTSRTSIAELVDHPRPFDDYTRLLHIFYSDREQSLPKNPKEAVKYMRSSLQNPDATHIISGVSFGIDAVIVLQLPPENHTASQIDNLLRKLREIIEKSDDVFSFIMDSQHIVEKIVDVKAYSNISELTKMTSLFEICRYINGLENKSDKYRPVGYTLWPVEWLYSRTDKSCVAYILLKESDYHILEQYLVKIANQMRRLKYSLDFKVNKLTVHYPKELMRKVYDDWENLKQEYLRVLERLRNLVVAVCSNETKSSKITEALQHKDQINLIAKISTLKQQVHDLEMKKHSNDNFDSEPNHNDFEVLQGRIKENKTQKLLQEKLPLRTQQNQTNVSNSVVSASKHTEEKTYHCQFSPPPSILTKSSCPDEVFNILLLGESGVGKSTFINAFANYHAYETLDKAEKSKPVVLIPVSFLLTVGENFEERIVKFGDSDEFNNEDFDHPGQSVTQYCKSYVFTLNQINGRKIRIIDTPGFGDTRGIDADNLAMQYILEYINNLTHVNAICFLLKPNVSEIYKFFKNCLTQILDLLGPRVSKNIVFCFTNCRATFYGPGDTASLLKHILKSFSNIEIPFKKENTFCFDNESFRYLVAWQKGITFDNDDRKEYENSWLESINESRRLFDYISTELSTNHRLGEHQSIKNAQLQITHMIRPMLEAMRNILRNMIINDMNIPNESMELKPQTLYRPAALCLTCKLKLVRRGKFWVVRGQPHEIYKECHFCDCPPSRHIAIDYQLEYEYSTKASDQNSRALLESLNRLSNISAIFAYFIMDCARSSKDDPFWIGLTQMINEENDIDQTEDAQMNRELAIRLTNLLRDYEKITERVAQKNKYRDLPTIYSYIQNVCKYPMVATQMQAIKKTQAEIMKLYEYQVTENLTK